MDIRRSVLAALDTTTGVLDRPKFAALALSGGDFALADLDLDSLSAYEVIMALEDEYAVNIAPVAVLSSRMLSDLIDAVTHAVTYPT